MGITLPIGCIVYFNYLLFNALNDNFQLMKINTKHKFTYGKKLWFIVVGFISLIWFLIRVIPKPQRAMYPCQRVAFPLASAFVIWLTGFTGSFLFYKKAQNFFKNARYLLSASFFILALLIFGFVQSTCLLKQTKANTSLTQSSFDLADSTADSSMVAPKAVVGIVRSDKPTAEDIDSLEIYSMVQNAVELAGGFKDLIHDSCTVVLKPNMVVIWVVDANINPLYKLPEKVNSVTTDYRVIQAVVNLVRKYNPHGKVYVMEGSASDKTRNNMEAMGWFKIKGVDDFICLDEACGAWRDYSAKELVKVSLPSGKALYTAANNEYYMNKIYYNADVVISLPVLKTHDMAAVTGAVKNVAMGATPLNIYGSDTTFIHTRAVVINHGSESNNYSSLHDWIHDYYMCRPVNFAVMDALTGMQDGPSPMANYPKTLDKKNVRCILASRDPLAMDAIEALMIQVDPSKVKYLATLHNDGLGCADPKYIRVKGMRVDQVKDHFASWSTYAKYSDFTAPNLSVNSYTLTDDSLNLNLITDPEVVKVEISVDDQMLAPIITRNFDNIRVKTGKVNDPKQVKIFAYDRFLNCTIVNLDGTTVSLKQAHIKTVITAFPNPCINNLTIESNQPFSHPTLINIYDLSGNLIKVTGPFSKGETIVHLRVSDLPVGVYQLIVKDNQKYLNKIRIIKE